MMSLPRNESSLPHGHQPPVLQTSEPDPDVATPDRVAHELANLLDGSMRTVSLLMTSFRQRLSDDAVALDEQQALRKLQTTSDAMNQMATLIRRWLDSVHRSEQFEHDSRTLTDAVDHAVRLLDAAAGSRDIEIHVQLDRNVATLPAGPIYPIVANALRNSIEAIDTVPASGPQRGHRIDIIARKDDGDVVLTIADDGPGINAAVLDDHGRFRVGKTTKPSGHGLGLQLCQEIAQSISGSLELRPGPDRGAQLVLRYPIEQGMGA